MGTSALPTCPLGASPTVRVGAVGWLKSDARPFGLAEDFGDAGEQNRAGSSTAAANRAATTLSLDQIV